MDQSKLLIIAFAGLLAIIPAIFWGYIFFKKHQENKATSIRLFLSGALAVAPLLLYKYLWQFFPWINAFLYTDNFKADILGFSNISIIPFEVITTFMLVGLIEELAKFSAMKVIHHKKIVSITDSVEFFIIVALGFSFAENIIYFYNIMQVRGPESVLMPFVFRSLFSTFAHVMFSGTLGYFYGMACFAQPVLEEPYNQHRWPFLRKIINALHLNKIKVFHDQKIAQGVMMAIVLHAVFNILLEMNWTFLIIPYLTGGFIFLSYLFDSKTLTKNYNVIDG